MMAMQSNNAMTLNQLLEKMQLETIAVDVPVHGMAMDSRQIVAGDVFIACAGFNQHGLDHAEQAVANGAVAVLAEVTSTHLPDSMRAQSKQWGLPVIPVADLSSSVSEIAGLFYHQPSLHIPVIGITGTNGKTSCSHFIASVCQGVRKVGVMGTLGNGYPGDLQPSTHTTMDPVSVQAQLALFVAQQADLVAMEVSSHALKQKRVAAVQFDTAVLTNFSRDHLDYHGTMADYASAKSLLFKMPGLKNAIINGDDELGEKLIQALQDSKLNLIVYGSGPEVQAAERYLKAQQIKPHAAGLDFKVDSPWGDVEVHLPLLGEFNVMNALVAMAVMINSGLTIQDAAKRLQQLTNVNGRMQLIAVNGKPKAVVDFAHTPDALEQVLLAIRAHVNGRLICVFGCGGNRDKGKRPLMGAIAEKLSDQVVLTNDNPRNEDPRTIIDEILAGMKQPAQVRVELDREKAIADAIGDASGNDVILIAGKGHESTQIVGDQILPFNDVTIVSRYLQEAD